MRQATIRWTIYILALCVFGPLAGMLTGSLRATDGSHAATPLSCTNTGMGLLMGLGAVGIALLLGVIAAKLQGVAAGFSTAGIILAWAAWKTGTIDDMIRTSQSGSPLIAQSLEGVVFGVLIAGVALAIWLMGGKGDGKDLKQKLLHGAGTALPVAVIAGAAAAWFIAVTPIKGQAVFGAIAAGVVGAAAAKLVDGSITLPTLVVPIVALAVLGPLSGYAVAGGTATGVVQASYAGRLFPLANITALDWIAGAMIGIPLGVAWAASMVEKKG
jgi:hypothetical protein